MQTCRLAEVLCGEEPGRQDTRLAVTRGRGPKLTRENDYELTFLPGGVEVDGGMITANKAARLPTAVSSHTSGY